MTAKTISVTPAAAKASIWCKIIGLLPNSTNGFGNVKVNGLNLVPYPPTKINPFMMCDVCDEERKMCWKFFFFFGSVTDYMLDEKSTRKKLRVSEF